MERVTEEFVERMGLMMEGEGMPRIAGRIFGFLLLHEGAFSLDELAEALHVSKASVSTNARHMEQFGLLERSSEPGDRRDYYRMGPEAWARTVRVAQRKWEAMRQMLTEAAASLPDEMETGRRRLIRAEQFHVLMISQFDELLDRWKRRSAEEEETEKEEMAGMGGD